MIYNIGIFIYRSLVYLASFFDKKIAKMWAGQKAGLVILKEKLQQGDRYIWLHAASLGEFEQGRPLIERLKQQHPECKILLTFFSPSGYEVRKDYPFADIVCYLPMDTPRNARRFVQMVKPEVAVLIKYEFWANYLYYLKKYKVRTYVISAIFREKQVFFKWYGRWYRNLLRNFKTIFVQDERSRDLLQQYHINNVVVSGDTRFDRVATIAAQAKQLPYIENFVQGKKTIVAGSSWEKDEDLFIEYFNRSRDLKLIIAPHVTSKEHITCICSKLKKPHILFSEASEENVQNVDCLIIDAIGFLSSVYRYGSVAYIGGGFGAGIHNVLEAAVYGMPVIFGTNYHKFREARQLIRENAAFAIADYPTLQEKLNKLLLYDDDFLRKTGDNARRYVQQNMGATEIILSEIMERKS
ncbi:MAG: 3-deoxy-D-manno-octulosonic acid transferase [Prevotellaceae bacterium]|nr:3-deoxy-D-manno-octulosonic acid transferase [Prevotellaceae bacterium]